MNLESYIDQLNCAFSEMSDPEIAAQQKTYMKGKFEYYGIKAPVRREIQKPFLTKDGLPEKKDWDQVIQLLWGRSERENQMFALDLSLKYMKKLESDDIQTLEYMIIQKSWWDTVDLVASHLVGQYFKLYPETRDQQIKEWMASGNLWLQRTCILFQLKYKDGLDTDLLVNLIDPLLGSNEFFINKAIGWVLREYSKTSPEWVIDYANRTNLSTLSRKEALRRLI